MTDISDKIVLPNRAPLDENFYNLDHEETAFYKAQTGIQDDAALKQHIIRVQTDAYEIYPYPCIRRFAFTKLKISRLPAYSQFLQLGRERIRAIFLDIGCCFGNDVRKAIADGFPLENAIASDLQPEFWELGHQLFNSTPESFPVPFVPGNAFDQSFLQSVEPFYNPPETEVPALSSLTSITPLLGHVSAIHSSSLFHLFDEEGQLKLAHALAGLLSPEPGSMIFGSHGGRPVKGLRTEQARPNTQGRYMFCHSPDSWRDLWDGVIFKKGTVRVESRLKEQERKDQEAIPGAKFYVLEWSVTRV